ncbi:MAG: hypothetical protein LBR17_01255 [Bacteroidales bacterium]|jgi:hypothetical protein|nr:hypothetical protein [Bacteroidales bacterium]
MEYDYFERLAKTCERTEPKVLRDSYGRLLPGTKGLALGVKHTKSANKKISKSQKKLYKKGLGSLNINRYDPTKVYILINDNNGEEIILINGNNVKKYLNDYNHTNYSYSHIINMLKNTRKNKTGFKLVKKIKYHKEKKCEQ